MSSESSGESANSPETALFDNAISTENSRSAGWHRIFCVISPWAPSCIVWVYLYVSVYHFSVSTDVFLCWISSTELRGSSVWLKETTRGKSLKQNGSVAITKECVCWCVMYAYWHIVCKEISILKCISKLDHVQIEIIAQIICKNGLFGVKQISSHSPMRYHNLLWYYCNWDRNYTTNTVNDPIKL